MYVFLILIHINTHTHTRTHTYTHAHKHLNIYKYFCTCFYSIGSNIILIILNFLLDPCMGFQEIKCHLSLTNKTVHIINKCAL